MKHSLVRQADSMYEKSIRESVEMEQINELNSFLKVNSKSIVKDETKKILRKFDKEKKLKLSREKIDQGSNALQNDYIVYLPKRNYLETPQVNDRLTVNKIDIFQNSGNYASNPFSYSNRAQENFPKISDKIKLGVNNQRSNKITIENEEIDYMKFKSYFLLKFANSHESYEKLLNNLNMVSLSNQKILKEQFKNIKALSDKKERILFDSSGNNIGNNIVQVKDYTKLFYDFEFFWLKISEILFKELKSLKDDNMQMLKKQKDEENSKDVKDAEILKLTKFIQENDMNFKSIMNGKKLRDLNEIKEEYEKKEKINLLNTYRLEEEIREMTSLIEKEREFYNKFQESQAIIYQKKKEVEDMRTKFSQEMEEKKIRISFLNNEKNEFIKKIIAMEKELKDYQEANESSKKIHIEFHTQIKILRQSLIEKEENIQMVTEEANLWKYEYEKARESCYNAQQTVTALEIKINALKREKANK